MRFDSPSDKLLMQQAPTTGSGGNGSIQQSEERILGRAAETADPNAVSAQNQRVQTTRQVQGQVSGAAGTAGVEISREGAVGIARATTENASRAAQYTQESRRKIFEDYIAAFDRAIQYQMANENSIEQMKANFSGMIEVLGTVAKFCGAEDFGNGCLELAKKLRPAHVNPHPELIKNLRGATGNVEIFAKDTAGQITGAQADVNTVVANGQEGIRSAAGRAIDDTANAPYMGVAGMDKGGSRPGSSGRAQPLGAVGFNTMIEGFLTGKPGEVITIGEQSKLTKAFAGIAGQDGVINSATEAASLRAAIRGNVSSTVAENKLLRAAGLTPNAPMGG